MPTLAAVCTHEGNMIFSGHDGVRKGVRARRQYLQYKAFYISRQNPVFKVMLVKIVQLRSSRTLDKYMMSRLTLPHHLGPS